MPDNPHRQTVNTILSGLRAHKVIMDPRPEPQVIDTPTFDDIMQAINDLKCRIAALDDYVSRLSRSIRGS